MGVDGVGHGREKGHSDLLVEGWAVGAYRSALLLTKTELTN